MRPDTRHETNDHDTAENMYDGMSERVHFGDGFHIWTLFFDFTFLY